MQDILDRIWENSTLMKDEREKQPERFFSYWQPAAIGLITFSASILATQRWRTSVISTAVPVASLYGYGQYRYGFEQYRNKIEQNKKPDDFQTSSRKHIDQHETVLDMFKADGMERNEQSMKMQRYLEKKVKEEENAQN